MRDPTAGWHAEHENFTRLLDLFEREVAVFHSGERPDYELLLDIVTYLHHFPGRTHHPREDVAFARLVQHDPSLAPIVARLHQEHRIIAEAGSVLRERLEAALGDTFVERSRVEAECALFLVYYRHHVAAEENGIMPRAASLLTPADWKAVAAAVAQGPDPLFGTHVEERYRSLRRRIDTEARR
jgi:hemerythrin-like domain-containing protein